ncbi:hypothetical protein Fmac_010813 [Flemingia macrophylla]|uniref:GDSL esterase/lipase n=1 Tax=Flemingia macrophylla TaxID=520843 RepID=A0ABD1MKN1_9FABA
MESLLSVSCWFVTMILKLDTMGYCPELKSEKEHKALFTFGDSLYDPGNNVYLNTSRESSTYWPYGETFFKHPTGRYSDGRVVPDFIATFAGLPMIPPYLKPGHHHFTDGANFASAGACIFFPSEQYIDLRGQLGFFRNVVKSLNQELGNIKSKIVLNNAVYMFSIGGPDYGKLLSQNPNVTESYKNLFVKMLIGNLTDSLKEVYSLGGRKFALQNVGPLGCSPHKRIDYDNCDEGLLSMARQHNIALSAALDGLEEELSGFRYSIFDYYHALLDRVLRWARKHVVVLDALGEITVEKNMDAPLNFVATHLIMCGLMAITQEKEQVTRSLSYCGVDHKTSLGLAVSDILIGYWVYRLSWKIQYLKRRKHHSKILLKASFNSLYITLS